MLGAALSVVVAVCAMIAWPQPLFAYGIESAGLKVYSDRPIPENQGRAFLRDVAALLEKSPLPRQAGPYSLFIANDSWRRRLVFLWASRTGGVVFYPVSFRHGFLSGADFGKGALISPAGTVIRPPRTLAYYGAHELTHVITGQHVGTARFHLMPRWVREGLADYVGLRDGMMPEALAHALDSGLTDQQVWDRYGFYARYRLLVAYFLEREKWSREKLMRSSMSYEQARAMVHAGLANPVKP